MPQISIEQILRQSLSAVRHGWVTILALGAVITAPAIVLQLAFSEQVGAPFSVPWVANVMVGLVATPLYAASMVAATTQVLREHPASFAVALGTAARRWPASLAVYLISTCGVVLTFAALDLEAVAEGRQAVSALYVLGHWLVGLVVGPLVWVLSTATYFELIRVRGELPGDLVQQTAAVFD